MLLSISVEKTCWPSALYTFTKFPVVLLILSIPFVDGFGYILKVPNSELAVLNVSPAAPISISI